ncbi:MAG: acyltransferase, partial [Moorea sp. SIO3E2]|nr:acyltransferase [Moorena sp. SIO3E2]
MLRTIYAQIRSSGNSINLKGKDNSIYRSQAILKSCKIHVEGNQNTICIDRGAYLQEVKIHLKGDNLKLNIGRSVFIGNGSILWMENSKSLLDIGEYSSLEKVGIAVAEG